MQSLIQYYICVFLPQCKATDDRKGAKLRHLSCYEVRTHCNRDGSNPWEQCDEDTLRTGLIHILQKQCLLTDPNGTINTEPNLLCDFSKPFLLQLPHQCWYAKVPFRFLDNIQSPPNGACSLKLVSGTLRRGRQRQTQLPNLTLSDLIVKTFLGFTCPLLFYFCLVLTLLQEFLAFLWERTAIPLYHSGRILPGAYCSLHYCPETLSCTSAWEGRSIKAIRMDNKHNTIIVKNGNSIIPKLNTESSNFTMNFSYLGLFTWTCPKICDNFSQGEVIASPAAPKFWVLQGCLRLFPRLCLSVCHLQTEMGNGSWPQEDSSHIYQTIALLKHLQHKVEKSICVSSSIFWFEFKTPFLCYSHSSAP